jgi:hypothetical protein
MYVFRILYAVFIITITIHQVSRVYGVASIADSTRNLHVVYFTSASDGTLKRFSVPDRGLFCRLNCVQIPLICVSCQAIAYRKD